MVSSLKDTDFKLLDFFAHTVFATLTAYFMGGECKLIEIL